MAEVEDEAEEEVVIQPNPPQPTAERTRDMRSPRSEHDGREERQPLAQAPQHDQVTQQATQMMQMMQDQMARMANEVKELKAAKAAHDTAVAAPSAVTAPAADATPAPAVDAAPAPAPAPIDPPRDTTERPQPFRDIGQYRDFKECEVYEDSKKPPTKWTIISPEHLVPAQSNQEPGWTRWFQPPFLFLERETDSHIDGTAEYRWRSRPIEDVRQVEQGLLQAANAITGNQTYSTNAHQTCAEKGIAMYARQVLDITEGKLDMPVSTEQWRRLYWQAREILMHLLSVRWGWKNGGEAFVHAYCAAWSAGRIDIASIYKKINQANERREHDRDSTERYKPRDSYTPHRYETPPTRGPSGPPTYPRGFTTPPRGGRGRGRGRGAK